MKEKLNQRDSIPARYPNESVPATTCRLVSITRWVQDPEQSFKPISAAHLPHPHNILNQWDPGIWRLWPSTFQATERAPTKPIIPDFITGDPSDFTRLKIVLENLLPPDATNLSH